MACVFFFSSHLFITTVQCLWEFLHSLHGACVHWHFYWILPSLLRSLATVFPQPGTFLPPSIASLLERLSLPWRSCRVGCALNRPAILLFAWVLACRECASSLCGRLDLFMLRHCSNSTICRSGGFFNSTLTYKKRIVSLLVLLLLFWGWGHFSQRNTQNSHRRQQRVN